MKLVTAIYTPEGDGWWSVRLAEPLDGCAVITQGNGLRQTRDRLYDAMATALDNPEDVESILLREEIGCDVI